ncbi:MAG: hypothetical protein GY943_04380 [Chloroflexi bacterium]|nr:hypothetical protein [Chloroflexota bacterium]
MIKRILGLIMILVGLSGVAIAVMGARTLPGLIDRVGASLVETLQLTSQSLDTVSDSLLLAKGTIADLNTTMVGIEENMDVLGQAINETEPLLDQAAAVGSSQVPDSIEAIQAAIPDMAQVAAAVDSTLSTLNRFRIDEEFLGIEIQYDLGIDYNPTQPFDETVLSLGESLDGLPASLRSLQIYINVTKDNLDDISQGLFEISDDLSMLNGRLTEIDPLLDEYLRIVTETNDTTRVLRRQLNEQVEGAKTAVSVIMIWFAFSQLAPLYLGWELLAGKRKN